MLSLAELTRVAAVLAREIRGHQIQKIVQPDATTLVLTLYGGGKEGGRSQLLLSCHPTHARVSRPADARGAPGGPPRFAQYLRAHVAKARVEEVGLRDGDRQLAIRLSAREGRHELLLAIFGRRSNVVLLDAEGRIEQTLRPLAETRPELGQGDAWRAPASTPPRLGEDRFEAVPDADLLDAIEARYADTERGDAEGALDRRVLRVLAKEARNFERKHEKLSRELAKAREAVHLERQGELLKGVLSDVKRGDTEVVVRDPVGDEEVHVALDPTKSPAENLQAIFKRYQKGVRTLTKGGAQEEALGSARTALAALEADVQAARAAGGDALAALAARPDLARLLAKYAPAEQTAPARPGEVRERTLAGRTVPAKYVPRRYRTECGLEVWVGRSDAANDYLTVRLARGKDLFFHLDGAPGSHVILRTEGRDDPPSEAMLDACELAVHYSKQKKATRADVHVVPIRNVRKPKGAKPGLVMVHGGRSIHLRRSEARLARILAARIED